MKTSKRESRKAAAVAPNKQARQEWWMYGLALLAGLFVAFQVYAPAQSAPFLFDDLYLPMNMAIYENRPLSSWMGGVRPLLMFTYWLNNQIGGADTGSYHAWNVVFHFLNSLLVYLIARRLLQMAGAASNTLALFAGGLFLLHPAQTEAVAYIAGRSDNLSAVFFFGAYAVFLYRRSAAISWPASLAVLALFGAAAATKENTVVLPALLLLTDYFWNPGFTFEGIRRNWRLYAPLALGGVLGAIWVVQVLGAAESAGFHMKDLTWYQYLFTQFRVFFVYVRLFFLPFGQTVDYDFPISHSILDHGSALGLLGILALLAAAVYYRRRYPLACFGLFAFLILLAPTSSVIPIRDPISERRLYLPLIGLILVSIELLRRLRIGRTALAAVLAAVLVIAAGLTYRRNLVWAGAIPLWEDAVEKSPGKARAHFQLAYAYFSANRCEDAEKQYQAVANIENPDARLLTDWALTDNCLNRFGDGIAKLEKATSLDKTAHIYTQLAMLYAKSNQPPLAFEALDTAQKLDPNFEVTYIYRGQLFEGANDIAAAARQFRRALEINPRNEQALEAMERLRRRVSPAR
jgi:tetratricopeptide (TPR) repeat protein